MGRGAGDHHSTTAALRAPVTVTSCPASHLEYGLPRSFATWKGHDELPESIQATFTHKKLPIPWINTSAVSERQHPNWLGFDEAALEELGANRFCLCAICGNQLSSVKVFGHLHNPGNTTGVGMHPDCALLAFHYCPELQRMAAESGSDDPELFDVVDCEGHGLAIPDADPEYDVSDLNIAVSYRTVRLSELRQLAKTAAHNSGSVKPMSAV
jgi:hypothetical protein